MATIKLSQSHANIALQDKHNNCVELCYRYFILLREWLLHLRLQSLVT